MTFGKKIMDYADMLADQSSIPLAPKTLSELDYLQRRLQQSFRDLYEIGQQETIDAALLDMEALEHQVRAAHELVNWVDQHRGGWLAIAQTPAGGWCALQSY